MLSLLLCAVHAAALVVPQVPRATRAPSPRPSMFRPRALAHSPSSHVHHDKHMRWGGHSAVLDAEQRQMEREAERLTIVSALLNVGLSASKGVAGVAARSPVLIADAAHSLSDLCSDAIVWWALKMGMRKPTRGHPAGFGKFGALGALAVSGLLLSGAGALFREASVAVLARRRLAATSSAARGAAILAAALSIASKEWLARATLRAGRRCGSLAVEANAAHHRADALSSVAALVGLGGAACGLPVVDPLASLAVAAAVAHTGFEVGAQALDELTDATVDAATARELEAALSAADGLRLEHARQGGGGRIIATVALEVDDAASAGDVARAQRKVEQDLGAVSENVEMVFKLEVKPSEHSWANWVTKPSPIVVDALQDPFLARMAPVNKEEAALFRP